MLLSRKLLEVSLLTSLFLKLLKSVSFRLASPRVSKKQKSVFSFKKRSLWSFFATYLDAQRLKRDVSAKETFLKEML